MSVDIARPEIPLQVITPADVRASVSKAKRSLRTAATEIVWQIEMEAWRTLGYSSWTAMREAEYGGAAFMVPRKDRLPLMQRMRSKGLTQQEIANTAGLHESTVSRDLANASSDLPETVTNSRGQQRPASYSRPQTDDVIDAEVVEDDDPTEFCTRCGADTHGCECAADKKTDPAPAEPVTTTCPTCHGTGEVTR